MEIIFKNSTGASKGKQCEEFLSILKKLKFQLSTKDKMLHFYVNKTLRKFMMTTYANRNIEEPPAGSPQIYIDYQFGQDMYNLSDYVLEGPCAFSFDIEDLVKLVNHYYETKMSILKIQIQSDISRGSIEFQVPDQVEGGMPLFIQKIAQFPSTKTYENKDHIDYFTLFELNDEHFQKLKQIEDIKYNCCYQIHQAGIYLKNYKSEFEDNKCLLSKDDLFNYDSVSIKQKLKGNIYIQEPHNFLLEEIRIGTKKHYKKLSVNFILVKRAEEPEIVRNAYIEIEAQLVLFPKTMKRIICSCQISSQINPAGIIARQQRAVENSSGTDLLKNEESTLQGLRRVVMNRWSVPRAEDYFNERAENQRQKEIQLEKKALTEQTVTRKIKYKVQERD